MSAPLERPERYMMADHSSVLIPGDVAAWLIHVIGLRELRTAHRDDPRRRAVLMALTLVGHNHAAEVSGSDQRKSAVIATRSEWLGVAQVATQLRLTESRVRQELRTGALVGEKRGRSWRVHRTEFEIYRAARNAA